MLAKGPALSDEPSARARRNALTVLESHRSEAP
jgi:hypothetical protein